MDPVTAGQTAAQVAKVLSESQNVQQVLAWVCAALVVAVIALAVLNWRQAERRQEDTKNHGAALAQAEANRRIEVRELLEKQSVALAELARALDAEHDRSRAIGGPVDDVDQPNKSGARRRV